MASRPRADTALTASHVALDPGTAEFYREALRALNEASVPFLVGGARALTCRPRRRTPVPGEQDGG